MYDYFKYRTRRALVIVMCDICNIPFLILKTFQIVYFGEVSLQLSLSVGDYFRANIFAIYSYGLLVLRWRRWFIPSQYIGISITVEDLDKLGVLTYITWCSGFSISRVNRYDRFAECRVLWLMVDCLHLRQSARLSVNPPTLHFNTIILLVCRIAVTFACIRVTLSFIFTLGKDLHCARWH